MISLTIHEDFFLGLLVEYSQEVRVRVRFTDPGDTSWFLFKLACAHLITCNPRRIWQTCPVQEIYTSALHLPQQDKTSHPYHAQLPLCCQNPSEDATVPL